jgi:protein-S-isoprenylcysteine O-methyltransferase Ste14
VSIRLPARALLAFLALPGLIALLVPPVLAMLDPWRAGTWPAGLLVLAAGAIVLIMCVRDFLVLGGGTLAPWDPPRRLVVVGLYRYNRNPMYVGVLLIVFGWSLLLRSPLLLVYGLVLVLAFHLRVLWSEEPWLARQFGERWDAYAAAVPRWLPRLTPWRGATEHNEPDKPR